MRVAEAEDLPAILALHRAESRFLGHLPQRVFGEAVDDERVLVVPDGKRIHGYLLYRERRRTNDVAITHLAVARTARRRGVGSALVTELEARVSERTRILLKCRRDYPAHDFWLAAGFSAEAEGVGRSADGKLLTTFVRHLTSEPSLFDSLYESSQPFAVDLDVLLDLVTDRPQGSETRAVMVQLDQFPVNPVRTGALLNELTHHEDPRIRKSARRLTESWQPAYITSREAEWKGVQARIPDLDEGDARHLADAEMNDVQYLVSRDSRFQEAVERAQGSTSVQVVSPSVFVDVVERQQGVDYRPEAAAGMRIVPASDVGRESTVSAFLAHSHGEKKSELRRKLNDLFGSSESEVVVLVRETDEPVCLQALTTVDVGIECALIRTSGIRLGVSVVRHALARARRHAVEGRRAALVRITDEHLTNQIERALVAEGFRSVADEWVALAAPPGLSVGDLRRAVLDLDVPDRFESLRGRTLAALDESSRKPEMAAELERSLDPLVLVESSLPAVLVPIVGHWADRLLGPSASQLQLDTTDAELRGYREHVYFRSPRPSLPVGVPARVFWYRTRDDHLPSRVFAASVAERVFVTSVATAWGRFGDLGVLARSDIDSVADGSGRVMAIQYARTRPLERDVTFAELSAAARHLSVAEPPTPRAPRLLTQDLHNWLLGTVGVQR